ncbi:uncharacterized protein LOC114712188 [Neltuma alba]|uniref:uncharacterized protein LOC114712188 n=1 Tax=Neltuma alba TaxID=207710 RepID=UPI0010A2BEE7|nr:uncharacterized protein LOC114712188 [Prosopis alba]
MLMAILHLELLHHTGIIPIAKCLVDKNSNALSIPKGQLKLIPVTLAFRVGLCEMGRYLYSVTPLQVFKPENGPLGPLFLRGCFVTGDLGMKEIHMRKLQHSRATEILNLVCRNLTLLSEDKRHMIAKALLMAAKLGNVEFLFKVSTTNPELVSMVTFSQQKGHAFFNAVEYRQDEVFNLLRGFHFRNVVAVMFTKNHDNLLHIVAKLAPASQLNHIPGAALKMQREWQWFKAVESVVNPGIELRLNKEGLTPLDYFKKNHKVLRNEGEKWIKDTASSCSVVGALIVTIVFATAFTVPGGNDQASGYPIFLKEKLFKVFLISDAVSLFASTTSILTFLGILTSRYAEEDFLYSLPTKLIIGLSTLFLSIVTMLIAFSATIIIMWQHNSSPSYAFLPVIMLASVPLSLFVLLQFPLLVEIISSTYGPGIFHKKVKKWP